MHIHMYTYIYDRPCFPLPQRYIPSTLGTRKLEIYNLSDSEDEDVTIQHIKKHQPGPQTPTLSVEVILREYLNRRGGVMGGVGANGGHGAMGGPGGSGMGRGSKKQIHRTMIV